MSCPAPHCAQVPALQRRGPDDSLPALYCTACAPAGATERFYAWNHVEGPRPFLLGLEAVLKMRVADLRALLEREERVFNSTVPSVSPCGVALAWKELPGGGAVKVTPRAEDALPQMLALANEADIKDMYDRAGLKPLKARSMQDGGQALRHALFHAGIVPRADGRTWTAATVPEYLTLNAPSRPSPVGLNAAAVSALKAACSRMAGEQHMYAEGPSLCAPPTAAWGQLLAF